ncbi:CobW family GTP-binding protein [Niallia sp. FSL W8-0635]|uniref:CobW family GTP-binding protein n=1 Tax=Niallia sp. FSL W8-0635 TaxID=2975337 RepID=UPI0009D54DA0|nr:cobalamin synthesis protein [Mycobacteroides abscessus subsp. abscessus]HEO8421203.1 GTP-binding protein [Yersinia enterocolitica]
MKQTDIYVLSGFLGSGKTTLLKEILKKEKEIGRKVAVLMNELGKVSIDSNEIEEGIPLKELLGGCVCCTIQDEVEAQIQTLLVEEKPDVIYFETTGAAHPVETIDGILSPIFADRLRFKGIVTVINGKQWLERFTLNAPIQQLIIEQARHASLLIVNKEDQLTEAEKAKISFELQAISPNAFTLLTTFSKFPFEKLLEMESQVYEDIQKTSVHKLHLNTFVYTFKKTIAADQFEVFLRELPDTIYRIKGYVQFHQAKYPDLFQYSYGMPLFMKEEMKMPLNMVFIGENIDWKQVEDGLNQL